jgi:hypothetical protein
MSLHPQPTFEGSTMSDWQLQLAEPEFALARAERQLPAGMFFEISSTGPSEICLRFSCRPALGGPSTHWLAVMPALWSGLDRFQNWLTPDPTRF